jgi:hypothetical protein
MSKVKSIIEKVGTDSSGKWMSTEKVEELIASMEKEYLDKNRKLSYELLGVIVDVEQGPGFDSVCLNTVKRVHSILEGE